MLVIIVPPKKGVRKTALAGPEAITQDWHDPRL